MPEDQPLIPVFIPSLAAILANGERSKGSPLTAPEIEAIRDKAACIMMDQADAAKMDESRGYRDVNPQNCWVDWHRLRAQMTGGYLPKIVLCIPGNDSLRPNLEPLLRAENVEHEFRPHDPNMLRAFKSSSITWPQFTDEDLARIDGHSTVLYALSKNYTAAQAPAVARSFLSLGHRLLDAGGHAIKVESAGISHPATRWAELDDTAARGPDLLQQWSALFHAYVVHPIGSKTDLYTCGMHLLGAPDLIISTDTLKHTAPNTDPARAAIQLFRSFALYLLAECQPGQFASGHTFRASQDAPRYRVTWEPCLDYPEDSFLFNPFGLWRFAVP